ncbi:glycerate kinase [Salinibacterium sp. UTAS2018]|uniref:glycerate kinase n=1 Tax=Salinibacterium sp. UTAS2018 TaxID=2508880 RepID=UPI0010097239|nr:glycerate kinase [Salinibacterium sp. UTAS2018]QAV69762.1 glycerate kinase [Salinibacterium sp. UTAS2018]
MSATENPVVIIAPDSFKGSLSAADAAAALERGAREMLPDTATVLTFPMADGGEGSLDAVLAAWLQPPLTMMTVDAIGREREASYGLDLDGKRAVIEAAQASGLPHVLDVEPQPLRADSYGVGLIAAHVIERGARDITLFLGGSASTDGGSGLLRALGARFLDDTGTELAPGGGALTSLTTIDLSGLLPGVLETTWRIAVDVTNPLTGSRGAAQVFGPQKGATASDVAVLDAGLTRLTEVLASTPLAAERGFSAAGIAALPGIGAAGGTAAPLVALFGAELERGAQLVADTIGLSDVIGTADVIISGEGRLDAQSLDGKVVDYLRGSKSSTGFLVVVAAIVDLTIDQWSAAGIDAALPLGSGVENRKELFQFAAPLLEARGAHAIAEWLDPTDLDEEFRDDDDEPSSDFA